MPPATADARPTGPRYHRVQRAESWHGIAKRLSGSADPYELLGLVQRLKEVNPQVDSSLSCPPFTAELVIPSEWAERPLVDTTSPAGRQRIAILAVDELIVARAQLAAREDYAAMLAVRLKLEREAATEWHTIAGLTGWAFVRWAWAYYWKETAPSLWIGPETE